MVKNMHHEDNKAIAAGEAYDEHKKSEIEPTEEQELTKGHK